MQDMTSSICAETAEGAEIQLEDRRDGNKYWVGKMKDGKCWMLQNLALGSTTGTMSLTSNNSNMTSSWTLPKAYTSATDGNKNNTGTAVWNFGKWVLATPLLTTSCGTSGAINSLLSCIKVGFVDVSDSSKFKPTFIAKAMAWNGANTADDTLVAVNCASWSGSGENKVCTSGTYDAHYLVGNYYQWNAAVAGTGGTITNQDVSSSICPKGWKLPTRGTSNTSGNFYKLTNAYGVNSNVSGVVNGISYNIAGEPLRFVRNGFVDPDRCIYNAGQFGTYWSSRASSITDHAYLLDFRDSDVYPSSFGDRSSGHAVRCIAE